MTKINLSRDKVVDFPGISTCRATSFECLQPQNHVLCHTLNTARTGTFQYIDSDGIYYNVYLNIPVESKLYSVVFLHSWNRYDKRLSHLTLLNKENDLILNSTPENRSGME